MESDWSLRYSQLAYLIPLSASSQRSVHTVGNVFVDMLYWLRSGWRRQQSQSQSHSQQHSTLSALQPCDGHLSAGEMVLVLSNAAGGKSTLLRALAGRSSNDVRQKGTVRYNGLTSSEWAEQAVSVRRITALLEQRDTHCPLLTVRETLRFALDTTMAEEAASGSAVVLPCDAAERRVESVLEQLGLSECADTMVAGVPGVRGISGGQRRRVSLGEVLITEPRVLLLDELTNGLDAQTALKICEQLSRWTRSTRGAVMAALLQPTPECYALFGRLILLRSGAVLYDGPRDSVMEYMQHIGVTAPPELDTADFLVEFLAEPASFATVRMAQQTTLTAIDTLQEGESATEDGPPHWRECEPAVGGRLDGVSESDNCRDQARALTSTTPSSAAAAAKSDTFSSTAGLRQAFLASRFCLLPASDDPLPSDTPTSITPLHTGKHRPEFVQYLWLLCHYCHCHTAGALLRAASVWSSHLRLNMSRSWRNTVRNRLLIVPRLVLASVMGCLLGGVFYQLSLSNFQARLGLFMFSLSNIAFANAANIPVDA